ncbi:hypothetical protein AM629_20395 [Photorhabdus heterorhabditis]|uniref:Type VI secretion protein n=1 Tax=Photorhabdus heterorhabditis TaxID=880156 RepID=A0ABR5K724_9GAMM|nr:hypothetical protein [Photorhabdus heterorhabditis]KOY60253.1 hypothetical protein AM629_20395 [Photorhabdus heterorhabditis]
MSVNLDAIPDKAPRPVRPITLRWLLFLIACLVTGAITTLWFWKETRSGSVFWYSFFVFPFSFWLLCFGIRRLGYQCQQVWADGWDRECQAIREREIRRGQRSARLIFTHASTPVGHDVTQLPVTLQEKSVLMSQGTLQDQDEVIQYARLSAELPAAKRFMMARDLLLADVLPLMAALPSHWRRYCSIQLNVSESDVRMPEISLPNMLTCPGQGLAVLDNWLDIDPASPSVLIIIAADVQDIPLNITGEAVVALMFSNHPLAEETELVIVHRPHREPVMRTSVLIERALLWAKQAADNIHNGWLTGWGTSTDSVWSTAIEQQGLLLKDGETSWLLEKSFGDTGYAAPWLALICASEQARQEQTAQLYAHKTRADQLWGGVITPSLSGKQEIS